MNILRKPIVFLFLIFSVILCGCKPSTPVSSTGIYFDTVISVTINDRKIDKTDNNLNTTALTNEELLAGCMELAQKYENLFSPTKESSDIWKINNSSTPVSVSPETINLLELALVYSELTGGVIDPTIKSVSDLWDFTGESPLIPSDARLSEALSHVNYQNIQIDKENQTIQLTDSEANISLGFIAKGYIADQMKAYLIDNGVTSAMINLGGNVLAIGQKPDKTNYVVGITTPFEDRNTPITTVEINDISVVTSGVYERFFMEEDVCYHHILDAKTGYPIWNNLYSVSIIGPSSTICDALSTTVFSMGFDEGYEYINSLEDYNAIFVTDELKVIKTW